MGFSTSKSPLSLSPSFFLTQPRIPIQPNPSRVKLYQTKLDSKSPPILRCLFHSSSRKRNPDIILVSCLTIGASPIVQASSVFEKVQSLDFEFKSLSEPIDRVKRLLHYATLLLPFDESSRIQENRVMGCTAQVWLEVKMDQNGLMRFRVDSDSEITKGFCSCLIWLLDGAEPDEVLCVKTEDLSEMNVGLPSRGNSRVNTWHNVLNSMQKMTKYLVEERDRKYQCLESFSSLLTANGSCKETQPRYLAPEELKVEKFVTLLKDKNIGVFDKPDKNSESEQEVNGPSNFAV